MSFGPKRTFLNNPIASALVLIPKTANLGTLSTMKLAVLMSKQLQSYGLSSYINYREISHIRYSNDFAFFLCCDPLDEFGNGFFFFPICNINYFSCIHIFIIRLGWGGGSIFDSDGTRLNIYKVKFLGGLDVIVFTGLEYFEVA